MSTELNKAYTKEKWILGGASGRMITTKSGYFGDGFIADVDTKANAEFIINSCNNNQKLISALDSIATFAEKALSLYANDKEVDFKTLAGFIAEKAKEAIKKSTA